MNLTNPKTLISRPEPKTPAQEDVLKTLGNRDLEESVAISIGSRILNPYFSKNESKPDEIEVDFSTKLIGENILIKVCINLLGKVDTDAMVGLHGHVAGKNFEVIERLGQHDVEVDHFTMYDQGIIATGRVRLTILAYKLIPSKELVSKRDSFSLIMHSYFDQKVTKQLSLPEAYGSLYSHHESKLRDTILTEGENEVVVNGEFNKILAVIEESVAQSEYELTRFLKAMA